MTDAGRLAPGDRAPTFSLDGRPGQHRPTDRPQGQQGDRLLLPRGHDPGCTTQACDFTATMPRLHAAAGYAVLGISPDKPEKLGEVPRREARSTSRCSPTPTKATMARTAPTARSSSTARPWSA